MKKTLIICFIVVIILFCISIINGKLFSLEHMCIYDYKEHNIFFNEIVLELDDDFCYITKDDYDSNSSNLVFLFETLDYEFISITNKGVFFCKGYDGMSGVGILYMANEHYINQPKDFIVKKLGRGWFVFREHYL